MYVYACICGKKRQADLREFEASLVYRASSRTSSKATEKPCLEKQTKRKRKRKKEKEKNQPNLPRYKTMSTDLGPEMQRAPEHHT